MTKTEATRERDAQWVKARKCPECKCKRLHPGPDYDRWRITCLNCGYRFRVNNPFIFEDRRTDLEAKAKKAKRKGKKKK